ncbi:unnamed protein product [Ilex paraguariensis]|uniref:ZF-HD dimerization-type domain-containing protein n=1 Tax=Ilex paraguariensis TaxID=185542 RepID=A0ABC8TAU7_9AQUA
MVKEMNSKELEKKVCNGSLSFLEEKTKRVMYKECRKNHAANIGRYAVDGCHEFMPAGEEGTSASFQCAACTCHRNFHRKEVENEYYSSSKGSVDVKWNKRGDSGANGNGDKKLRSEDEYASKSNEIKREVTDRNLMPQHMDHGDKIVGNNMLEKKRKKRKRKQAEDLRIETVEGLRGSKRREHKKQRLEAMKKKHKKVDAREDLNFPGRDLIKFGEVVEAPPKLLSFPKVVSRLFMVTLIRLRTNTHFSVSYFGGGTGMPKLTANRHPKLPMTRHKRGSVPFTGSRELQEAERMDVKAGDPPSSTRDYITFTIVPVIVIMQGC